MLHKVKTTCRKAMTVMRAHGSRLTHKAQHAEHALHAAYFGSIVVGMHDVYMLAAGGILLVMGFLFVMGGD